MLSILAKNKVQVSCIKPTPDDPNPITVNGIPKTCKSWIPETKNALPQIRCDFDRFYLSALGGDVEDRIKKLPTQSREACEKSLF